MRLAVTRRAAGHPDEKYRGGREGENGTRARSHGNVTHHPPAGAKLRRAARTEPQERRRTGRGKDQLVRPGRAFARPTDPGSGTPREKPRRCMTRRGRRVRGGGACVWRVGRECDGSGSTGRPRTARSSRRREPATGRLPGRRTKDLLGRRFPIRPERPPPLVRHAEHLHFAIARKDSANPQGRVSRHRSVVRKGAGVAG